MININVVKEDILHFSQDKKTLLDIRNDLYVERMDLDKSFSKFLAGIHHYDMQADDTSTENWKKYKEMMKYYKKVEELIVSVDFYIGKFYV